MVWKEIKYENLSQKEIKLLVAEVNIMRSLKDPFIVRYYERILDKERSKIYIVMEFCEQGDLKKYIDKHKKTGEPVEEEFIWKILAQMLIALKVCHTNERKIIHRDIKPGNIFLDKEGNVKLGDFGLSKELQENSICATTNVGTPYYMSPEQVGGNKYDEKCDIWALGCILHEMACLKVPFRAENYLKLAEVITKAKMARLPDRYSEELQLIIDKMTEKDPKSRPTAAQLLEYPRINHKLMYLTIKDRTTMFRTIDDLDNRERQIQEKEEELNKKEEELKRMQRDLKNKYNEVKEFERQLKRRSSKINMMQYNTSVSRSYKGSQDNKMLSKTIDGERDASLMYSSEDKKVNASIKFHNRLRGGNTFSDDKENVNTSNSNLLSSNSSTTRNNITRYANRDSKNFSGSHTFEDSQGELGRSKNSSQRLYKEYPSKKVNINLYSDNNSSGSFEVDRSLVTFHNKSNDKTAIGNGTSTAPASTQIMSKANNALSKHLDNKSVERQMEQPKPQENYHSKNMFGLPPSGQNKLGATDVTSSFSKVKKSQDNGINFLKRNFSTNQISRLQNNEDNSRNRLGNRKSIPATYRGENFDTFQAPDNTVQIMSSRHPRDDVSNSSRNTSITMQLPLKKTESTESGRPSLQTTKNPVTLKKAFSKNSIPLAKNMSRGKLIIPENVGQKIQPNTQNKAFLYEALNKQK